MSIAEIEQWKNIPCYNGAYQISNLGNVMSLRRKGRRTTIILRRGMDKNGYYQVVLHGNGKRVTKKVHQLVLESFVGLRPPKAVGRHLDGNKHNNNFINLSWGTSADNAKDAVVHGTSPGLHSEGIKNGHSKLIDIQVIKIKKLLLDNEYNQREIAKMFGISFQTISLIKLKRIWKHII